MRRRDYELYGRTCRILPFGSHSDHVVCDRSSYLWISDDSIGTNDLTQMTFGFSRDDAGKFLNAYYDTKIFENDPFAKLDQTGVGKLMEMAIKLGKPVNPKLHVGICGEHGGDPSSVEFCHKIGLDYVSCSPFRVPIARLAAAQAAIADK